MPSQIALALFTLLVSTLLWIDIKRHPSISSALWIPLLWIMYCGSRSVSYWLDPGTIEAVEFDYTAGNPIDRTFLMILIFLGIFILCKRAVNWSKVFRENGWIIALFIYFGISVIWSNFIDVSIKRWFRTVGDLVMVLVVLTERFPVDAMAALVRRCSFVLIPMSILLIKYFRHLGVLYSYSGATMWVGVTTHKNSLGYLAWASAVYSAWHIAKSWRSKDITFYSCSLVLLMSVWILIGPGVSNSKTSFFNFFIAILILLITHLARSRPKSMGRYVLAVGTFVLSLQLGSQIFLGVSLDELLVTSSGRDMTLTGRTFLWDELFRIAASHPVFGAGYGGFWVGNLGHDLWSKFGWEPESAHNGYIDVYLELGFVGVILLSCVIVSTYRNIVSFAESSFDIARFRLTVFFGILIYNYTESSFAKPTCLMWFLFLLVAVQPPTRSEASQSQERSLR